MNIKYLSLENLVTDDDVKAILPNVKDYLMRIKKEYDDTGSIEGINFNIMQSISCSSIIDFLNGYLLIDEVNDINAFISEHDLIIEERQRMGDLEINIVQRYYDALKKGLEINSIFKNKIEPVYFINK